MPDVFANGTVTIVCTQRGASATADITGESATSFEVIAAAQAGAEAITDSGTVSITCSQAASESIVDENVATFISSQTAIEVISDFDTIVAQIADEVGDEAVGDVGAEQVVTAQTDEEVVADVGAEQVVTQQTDEEVIAATGEEVILGPTTEPEEELGRGGGGIKVHVPWVIFDRWDDGTVYIRVVASGGGRVTGKAQEPEPEPMPVDEAWRYEEEVLMAVGVL